MQTEKARLALVDDHKLFRKGMLSLIEVAAADTTTILFDVDNGAEMMTAIDANNLPSIILMDINMPKVDGFESVRWLANTYPDIKVLVVSMIEKEESIVRMLRMGVKGFLSKDVEPKELGEAIAAVANGGYYYTDFITGRLISSLQKDGSSGKNDPHTLNEREMEFLRYACTELTYNEIASKMFVSPKTVDGYRAALFERLSIKSRVGLALYAVKSGFVNL